jgi:23S rRNA pseudouridine1911/1915/1917 synthase
MSEPKIIYEDKDFLAVNKPAGWLTHAAGHGKNPSSPALADWIASRYPEIRKVGDDPRERPGIVHRLDRETSGIILIPRNQEYFLHLKSLFQGRKIKKAYLALVHGALASRKGIIEEPIGIKSGTIRRSVGSGKMLKPAATEYALVKAFTGANGERFSLVKAFPLTGRTHQIRVHLKHLGHPIVGDRIYGRKKDPAERLMLHAEAIEFEAGRGKKMRLEAAPPEDFERIIGAAGTA